MPWGKILNIIKLIGPYVFEIVKVLLNGPHKQAVTNLREKGVI